MIISQERSLINIIRGGIFTRALDVILLAQKFAHDSSDNYIAEGAAMHPKIAIIITLSEVDFCKNQWAFA